MKNRFLISKNLFLVFSTLLIGLINPKIMKSQGSERMSPSVYSEWNRIKNVKISDSAQIVTYITDREIGDKKLAVFDISNNKNYAFDRILKHVQDPSGEFVLFTHGLSYESTKALKRKKAPKDKFPMDLSLIHI